ncbi:MAG TPA: restriction endonuclease subunit M, partial [Clostridiales bacterium]|nr:restriction endonuclease subunit M [Clostridiales bacterium]
MEKSQTKSKKRIREHGEVFTNEREVKAMCDLVAQECDRIDSRFLEPACGNGNFLAEILSRKIATVKRLYKSNPYDYERYSVLAITSIYGVDILSDNVEECRERLFKLWDKEYKNVCKKATNDETRQAVKYILSKNVLCGNALTLMQVDENQQDLDLPII